MTDKFLILKQMIINKYGNVTNYEKLNNLGTHGMYKPIYRNYVTKELLDSASEQLGNDLSRIIPTSDQMDGVSRPDLIKDDYVDKEYIEPIDFSQFEEEDEDDES